MEIVNTITKPNLFIVGAAKAGTTAIHQILGKSSYIKMSSIKEPNFFCSDIKVENFRKEYRKSLTKLTLKNKRGQFKDIHEAFIRNQKTYLELFDSDNKYLYHGESSVSYLYSIDAALNIYKFNPNSKIIIILRNPVDRAYSHFLMDVKTGRNYNNNVLDSINYDFNRRVKGWGISSLYIELGLYYAQVKRFMEVFPQNQVLIINYDEFKASNRVVVENIFNFLNIPFEIEYSLDNNRLSSNIALYPRNKLSEILIKENFIKDILRKLLPNRFIKVIKERSLSSMVPEITIEDKDILYSYFESDIEKLNKYLGFEFFK